MNRTQNDIQTIKKVNAIVREKLPEFASRYFHHNLDIKTPLTLYGYALDLAAFFKFLESISFPIDQMTIRDLGKITPQIIEDYLEYSRVYTVNGVTKERSLCAISRRYSTLSSFFTYFYRLDLIDRNPVNKVAPPGHTKKPASIPANEAVFEMLDFVMNGTLGGRKDKFHSHTKERDIAIVLLIMGAGIKASEAVELDIDDLHLDDGFIAVRSRKSVRTVFISDTVSEAVSKYLAKRLEIIPVHGNEAALFLSLQCRRICVRAVEKMIKEYSSAMFCGKDHLTPAALRQSFRNNLFYQAISMTSNACGNHRDTEWLRYRPVIEQYEHQKRNGIFS